MRLLELAIALAAALLAQSSPRDLFERARLLDEGNRNLPEAIRLYTQVVEQAKQQRPLAAEAQFRLGMLHERLGRKDEALRAFRAVVAEFSDQAEPVRQARARLGAAAPNGVVVRQVWAGPEANTAGTPSPDGRYFTYVDEISADLAIRDLSTGEKRRLTNKGSWFRSFEFALASVPSPDGKQVAYAWYNKDNFYDLRVVGLNGSEPRVLYRNAELDSVSPGGWSPDGKRILALFRRKDRTHQIALVSVADGAVRALKTFERGSPSHARFSPEGRYVAYDFPQQPGSRERDIYLFAVDGAGETPLVQHAANDVSPEWTPDGKRILFGSDRTGSMGLWSIPVADGKPAGTLQLVKPDLGRDPSTIGFMGFTRKGAYYYGLKTGMTDVYRAELDLGAGKPVVPPSPVTQRFVGSNYSPDWSPDGRELVFLSRQGPGGWGTRPRALCILSLERGEVRELPSQFNQIYWIRWSPDGRSFFAMAQTAQGAGIHRIDAQTGNFEPVVRSHSYLDAPAVWSRDGKAMFYLRLAADTSLMLMRDLETGQEKELYRLLMPSHFTTRLALSRDDRQLPVVVQDVESRSMLLKVMPAAGGEARDLLRLKEPEGISGSTLVWAPDGLHLLFLRDGHLWRVATEGGEPQRLGPMMEGARDLCFHPDGRRIAFTAREERSEVWVMENVATAR